MICPHCSANLLRKQRCQHRCGTCHREFALEPTENPLHLHDIRLRTLAETLSGSSRAGSPPLVYTADQLRWAASRKILVARDAAEQRRWAAAAKILAAKGDGCLTRLVGGFFAGLIGWGIGWGIGWFFGGVLAVPLAAAGIPDPYRPFVAPLVGFAIVVVLFCVGSTLEVPSADLEVRYPDPPISRDAFGALLDRWQRVYRKPPTGLLAPRPPQVVTPTTNPPHAVLFCPDPDIAAFLDAAGVAQRYPVVIVPGGPEWPPPAVEHAVRAGLPILVLHDADPTGCLTLPRLRAALPAGARVLDAGLRPRIARNAGPPLPHRPDEELTAELRTAGDDLDAAECAWLAHGHTVPLALLHPVRLLRAVEHALTHAVSDPDLKRAEALGFVDWPERVQ